MDPGQGRRLDGPLEGAGDPGDVALRRGAMPPARKIMPNSRLRSALYPDKVWICQKAAVWSIENSKDNNLAAKEEYVLFKDANRGASLF